MRVHVQKIVYGWHCIWVTTIIIAVFLLVGWFCFFFSDPNRSLFVDLPLIVLEWSFVPAGEENCSRTLLQPSVMMNDCFPTRLHSVSLETEHLNTLASSPGKKKETVGRFRKNWNKHIHIAWENMPKDHFLVEIFDNGLPWQHVGALVVTWVSKVMKTHDFYSALFWKQMRMAFQFNPHISFAIIISKFQSEIKSLNNVLISQCFPNCIYINCKCQSALWHSYN